MMTEKDRKPTAGIPKLKNAVARYAIKSLAALVASCVAVTSAFAASPSGHLPRKPSAATNITIAFPKTYDRYQTARLYEDFIHSLGKCAGVNFVDAFGISLDANFSAIDLLSEDKLIERMQEGKLQMALMTTGLIPIAMEKAGGIPYAGRGSRETGKLDSYRLRLIVRADSAYKSPKDLIGKKIAHSTPGSNSGNLAPRAFFPGLGLFPDKNYTVVFSKGHERSIMGTYFNFWQGAAVASDQFDRMVLKKDIKASDFRVLWESEPFPVGAWVMSDKIDPAVQNRIKTCTYDYRIPAKTSKLLNGSDGYLPLDPVKDTESLRFVMEKNRQ